MLPANIKTVQVRELPQTRELCLRVFWCCITGRRPHAPKQESFEPGAAANPKQAVRPHCRRDSESLRASAAPVYHSAATVTAHAASRSGDTMSLASPMSLERRWTPSSGPLLWLTSSAALLWYGGVPCSTDQSPASLGREPTELRVEQSKLSDQVIR